MLSSLNREALARVDWDLPDPKDRPVDEVRALRDDIADRVAALVADLADS